MGFTLDRVVVAPSPEQGWARHAFYDTGDGQMIAFWDLHDDPATADFDPSISRGLGLPAWTNHLAFGADTLEDLNAQRQRWLDHGIDVAEIDHGWCTSIYAMDPNDIMVEFCCTTAVTTDADRARALERAHGRASRARARARAGLPLGDARRGLTPRTRQAITPSARSAANRADDTSSSPPSTASVSAPSSGPTWRTDPGVRESFGTTPAIGTRSAKPAARRRIMSRAAR